MILWGLLVLVAGAARGLDPTDFSTHYVNKTVRPIAIDAGQTIK